MLTQPPSGWFRPGAGGSDGMPERPRVVARLVLPLPTATADEGLHIGARPSVAVSADGAAVAFIAGKPGQTQLYVRRLDQPDAKAITGTAGAESPFFSPDGSRVGFFADGKLKAVALAGGAPLPLAAAARPQGGVLGGRERVDGGHDLLRAGLAEGVVSDQPGAGAGSGAVESVAQPDFAAGELAFVAPEALPNGTVVMSVWTGTGHDQALIVAVDPRSGARRPLVSGGTNPKCAASGHLVFSRGGSVMAVAFDPDKLTVTGQPVTVEERVLANALTGAAQFAIGGEQGAGGTLVMVNGGLWEPKRTLVSVDRAAPGERPARRSRWWRRRGRMRCRRFHRMG